MVENAHAPSADEPELPDPYEIVSIRSVAAPTGMPGADWHRYEISQGANRIVGYRAGAADVVQEAIELIVLRLNMRRTIRRGRVHVVLHSKASRGLQ
jgi:hypothetical protein